MSRPAALVPLILLLHCGDMQGVTPLQPPAPLQPMLVFISSSAAFLDRDIELQIIGTGTHFDSSSTLDFGDSAISAESRALSPINLAAKVHVGSDARLSLHDVSVHTPAQGAASEETVALANAFTVEASLRAETTGAISNLLPGGLANLSLLNLDYRDAPFSSSAVGIVDGPRLLRLNGASAYRYGWLGLVDARLPPGPLPVTLRSTSPLGSEVRYQLDQRDDSTPRVASREAAVLSPGVEVSGEGLSAPLQANLYRISVTDPGSILMLQFQNVGIGLRFNGPTFAWAPPDGRFLSGEVIPSPSPDGTTFTSLALLPDRGEHYLSVFAPDYSGNATEYSYGITSYVAMADTLELREPSPPDSADSPLATADLTSPLQSTHGELSNASDVDYILVTAPRPGKIYVQAMGSPLLAVRIEIMQKDCRSPVASLRAFQNQFTAAASNTYCVVLRSATSTPYRLLLMQAPL